MRGGGTMSLSIPARPKRKKDLTKIKRYRYNIPKKKKNTKVKFPLKNQSIRWIKKEGIAILLNPKKGKYYRLNETSSLIWDLSDGTRNEKEIVHIVKEKFDAKNTRSVKNDVKTMVSDLHRKQLIILKKRRNKKIYGIWR